MPAATTHVEFARDVLRNLPQELHDQITNYPMYFLGSQGPDMLFFSHGSIPFITLKKYGELMHEEHIWDVVRFFEGRCMNDSDLRSYFCGYLCHYALDSTVHPLVYYFSKKIHDETGAHEGETHVTIEAEYDVWLLHQRGRSIDSYDVFEHMKPDALSCTKLAILYHDMFEEVFGIRIPLIELKKTVYDCPFYTRVLHPGSTFKYRLITKVETLIGLPHSFSGMMLNEKQNARALNLERTEFTLPERDGLTSTKSFPMLYGEAASLAAKLIESRTEEDFVLNFLGRTDPKH